MLRYTLTHVLNKGNLAQDRVMCEYSKSMYFSSLLIHEGGGQETQCSGIVAKLCFGSAHNMTDLAVYTIYVFYDPTVFLESVIFKFV